jgi:single-strand DNA-binding protein
VCQLHWSVRQRGNRRTEWHNVIAFGKLGAFAATLTKGAHIEVEGSLSSLERIIETREGSLTICTFSVRAESIRKLNRAESARESPS